MSTVRFREMTAVSSNSALTRRRSQGDDWRINELFPWPFARPEDGTLFTLLLPSVVLSLSFSFSKKRALSTRLPKREGAARREEKKS